MKRTQLHIPLGLKDQAQDKLFTPLCKIMHLLVLKAQQTLHAGRGGIYGNAVKISLRTDSAVLKIDSQNRGGFTERKVEIGVNIFYILERDLPTSFMGLGHSKESKNELTSNKVHRKGGRPL